MKKTLLLLSIMALSVPSFAVEQTKNAAKKDQVTQEKVKLSPAMTNTEDAEEQQMIANIKKRSTMLSWHQYTALATVGLLVATIATAPEGEGEVSDTHRALGLLSGVGYITAASLAIAAPASGGSYEPTNIKVHKGLALIHAPAFALTITAGLMAHRQKEDGKKVTGLAKLHSTFAGITAASLGLAAVFSNEWSLKLLPAGKQDFALALSKSF